jgi:hypothetical protein
MCSYYKIVDYSEWMRFIAVQNIQIRVHSAHSFSKVSDNSSQIKETTLLRW